MKAAAYEYRPAANLVLEADRSGPRVIEPSGEAESLVGKLGSTRMGDRVGRAKPAELEERLQKSRARRERSEAEAAAAAVALRRKRRAGEAGIGAGGGFLASLESLEGVSYRPRTKETRAAYEALLTLVQQALGDQPAETLAGAAEEVIAIMRAEGAVETQKRAMLGSLLGAGGGGGASALSNDSFFRYTTLTKALTDFGGGESGGAGEDGAGGGGMVDDDVGVAVVFDAEDEDEDAALDVVAGGAGGDGDDDIDEDAGDDAGGAAVHTLDSGAAGAGAALSGGASAAAAGGLAAAPSSLFPSDADDEAGGYVPLSRLDAFWLQRELSKYYGDALESQRLAREVLAILGAGLGGGGNGNAREQENRLVALLDFDKFDLVKLLLRNAARVFYVTRLRQAQSEEARRSVREAMASDVESGGPGLLRRIDATLSSAAWAQTRTQGVSDRVRREARELARDADAAAAASAAAAEEGSVGGVSMLVGGATSVMPGARSSAAAPTSYAGWSASLAPLTDGAAALGGSGGSSGASALVDLDALAFAAGAHLMSNKKVTLPDKSWRAQKKGYEEVHVPALAPRPFAPGEREIPISELPPWAQPAFAGMTKLNRVQSRLAHTALASDENMLLCAPTGAGKTNVAMLTILHEMGARRGADGVIDIDAFKIVYVAPMKALVQELVANFSQRLTGAFGLKVRELSGDSNLTKAEIAETHIIVTTPEKWDVITRKAGDRAYTALVRLIIIDEVHLLHDGRGAVLEAIVARTLRSIEATKEPVRIVGLSATLPNYEDVATFLRVRPESGVFYFDGSFRPCPLQQQYIGITEKKPLKRLALMNDICYEKVEEQAGRNQVLIFVHTRKETGRTARSLRDMFVEKDTLSKLLREDSASREILTTEAENITNAELKDLLPYGFGIHHAGMARADRTLVEELFADGHLQVLVCTATLAWGVNLPAHMVIIKGTQVYSPEKGGWTELSPLDVMQMLGRAGRPQFDTFGEGVILTGHSELQYYLSLMNQQLPIESQLVARLADTLNAEIVLGSVANLREASAWLGYTYLYVRMLRSPALYGAEEAGGSGDDLLLQRRLNLAHSAALLLDKHNLIRYDRRSGTFQSTALGRVASHYYLTHSTMATYNAFLKPTLSDLELFRLFSLSSEFKNVVVRTEEKEELRKLLERVPIPVKESMEEPSAKVNVLLQAYISRLRLEGLALSADMVYVHQSAGRLMRAIFEICLRRGWATLARRTLELCKMIDYRCWGSATPLRQFSPAQGGLSEEILRKLEKKDLPWARYYDLSSSDLGELVRLAKLGKPLHRLVHSVPRFELAASVAPLTRSLVRVELTLTPDFVFDVKIHGGAETFWVLVEDTDGEAILHQEQFTLKARYAEEDHTLVFSVPITEPMPPHYFVRVLSDKWLHSQSVLPISFRALVLPDKFLPHTELLDLAPLPVTALKAPEFEALYTSGSAGDSPASRLVSFNPIQTQTFPTLYESDADALIAAPSGSGKTLCAEFALLRLWANDPGACAVYIAPLDALVRERYEDWELRFGRGLGKAVVELTGELAPDLRLLERAHLVLATPRAWDAISRRWKKRRAVQDVRLYICDELSLIDAPVGGATYEVVVLRMRFSAASLAASASSSGAPARPPARIVGLSSSIANARDLGEWMGASPPATFSFHPAARPVPLEVRIQGFDVAHFGARLLAMARPAYSAVASAASTPGRSALVFTPSRKQAQLTAIDLVTSAASDGLSDRFLRGRATEAAMDAALATAGVRDAALAHCLRAGVGYTFAGQAAGERTLVERLFAGGALGVVVAPAAAAWGMGSSVWGAHCVVILGTEAFDGRTHQYVDYPVADTLRMAGRACRAGAGGAAARCVILCASNRKEHLKQFLYEPLPVESHLHGALHDAFNAEIVNGIIESKQDALDFLTWTFLYRRLPANPNFYALTGTSHTHLSDFLSELVDATIGDLAASQCVGVEADDVTVSPLNLGMVAAYYYVAYTTLEVFASSLTAKTKVKGLLEILSNATEFATSLPMRHGDDRALRALAAHLPLALPPPAKGGSGGVNYHDPHVKANVLLQAHLSRKVLPSELAGDRDTMTEASVVLLQAMVDVISSEGWLKPALAAMELSQGVVQGLWPDRDPLLMQVPHVTRELAERMAAGKGSAMAEEGSGGGGGIETVFDLIAMEDGARAALLGLSPAQLSDVARFCNRYPSLDVSFTLNGAQAAAAAAPDGEPPVPAPVSVHAGDTVNVSVTLTRDASTGGMEEGAGLGTVHAPLFPKAKSEGWWIVLGQPGANALTAIKRVALAESAIVKLDFVAPATEGAAPYKLFVMSDSYLGADQEYDVLLDVLAAV